MSNGLEVLEGISEWPHMFKMRPLLGNSSVEYWNTRIVMGVEREADGMTIKTGSDGRILAHLPGHDLTLFTGKQLGAEDTLSHLPETVVSYHPGDLIPIERSRPIDLGELHARYSKG